VKVVDEHCVVEGDVRRREIVVRLEMGSMCIFYRDTSCCSKGGGGHSRRSLLPAISLASPDTRAACFRTSQSNRLGPIPVRAEKEA
jgi:hypothetical protein